MLPLSWRPFLHVRYHSATDHHGIGNRHLIVLSGRILVASIPTRWPHPHDRQSLSPRLYVAHGNRSEPVHSWRGSSRRQSLVLASDRRKRLSSNASESAPGRTARAILIWEQSLRGVKLSVVARRVLSGYAVNVTFSPQLRNRHRGETRLRFLTHPDRLALRFNR